MHARLVRRFLVSCIALISLASSTYGGSAGVLDAPIRRALHQASAEGKTTLRNISLGRESRDTFEIEPMEVWAKDAKIIVYGAPGQERVIPPPAVKYFKGRVVGEDESAVFFSMSSDGTIRGMVLIGERRWNIGSGIRRTARLKEQADDVAPILISEIDVVDDLTDPAANWECHVDRHPTGPLKVDLAALAAEVTRKPRSDAGNVSGATYQLRIAVETDNEFCQAFGNNSTTISTYIGDLIGKASTVYSRDLKTTLVLGETHIRNGGAGTDPWTVTTGEGTLAALGEFGTYWHNNYSLGHPDPDGGGPGVAGGGTSVPRSSAVFLSGRLFSGGIAWSSSVFLCTNNFYCGADGSSCGTGTLANAYGGGYAFNGSSGSVETSVPDPEATVNGVQYGLPTTNYWMLLEVMHELGHNGQGPHTQCVALTAQDKIDYGTSRDFVDECYNRDGAGCYSGTTANCDLNNPGDPYCDAPPEKGTIMSYCHNIFSSGFRQSRYLFGKAGEPSFKLLGIFNTSLESATPNPTITAQSEPVACSAGRTASVATCSGCTYAWQITGGSITSSTTSSSITYTPSAASVTLTVTVITSQGCGITASKTVATSCGAVSAPTNVVATGALNAGSVTVSWTNSGTATSYNVYRSTDNVNFTKISVDGTVTTTPFADNTAAAGTAYMYKVRGVNSGTESTDSNRDFAVPMSYTDAIITATTTSVQAAHFTQLVSAANALRTMAGLGALTFTEGAPAAAGIVRRSHVIDLRGGVDGARIPLGFSAGSYPTDNAITAGVTTVKKAVVDELRAALQ